MNKCRIIIWSFGIIFLIFNILTPFFTIFTTIALHVLFYICFFALLSQYILFLLFEISIYGKYLQNLKNTLKKHFRLFPIIFIIIVVCFGLILAINLENFHWFIRDCPFFLNKLDYTLNFDRRCELYDKNNNSRYCYQYICSYDSSKDFEEIKEILDFIICTKFNKLIDNPVINIFKDVYNKKDKYYCSRILNPQEDEYSFAKAKDCRYSKYRLMLLFTYVDYFQLMFPLMFYISTNLIEDRFMDNNDQMPAINNRLEGRIHDNDHANLGRFLNFRRNNDNSNITNNSNKSTARGENPGGDIDFIPEKTINIIIENKKEIIINQNIKNISNDKTKKMVNHINSENINDIDINSDERIIRFSIININNESMNNI